MFLCQRLIGASADKYSCIYTILSVHCDLHYSSYNSHSSAPSMSSALRPDGEAPHHEQPLIMSSISGGFEYSHKKVCTHTYSIHTRQTDGCMLGWLQFNWKLQLHFGSKVLCEPAAEGCRTGNISSLALSLPQTSHHYLQHLFEPNR